MEGLNLNSPYVQQMLREHPEMANQMKFCYGAPPSAQTEQIVETGNGQSPQIIPIGPPRYIQTTTNPMVGQMVQQVQAQQPYADPYNMLTGMGLANYQMPTYNFTGALASPGYRDMNQPVTGGAPMMTIPGYSNPYMNNGFAVSGYDPRYVQPNQYYSYPMMYQAVQRNPFDVHPMELERQRRYMYGTNEDRVAIDRGFDSANHQTINNDHILAKMHVACMKYRGESEEAIQEYLDAMEEKHEKLRKEDEEFNKKIDPFNLDKYKVKFEDPDRMNPENCTINVRIIKDGKVVCEMNGENGFKPTRTRNRGYELAKVFYESQIRREQINQIHQYMHDHAVERLYDHVGIIEFFNVGFGHIHAVERQREWEAMAHDVTKLYDHNEFQQRLYANSRPQVRQKAYEQSLKQTATNNTPMGGGNQAYMPGGIPVPTIDGQPIDTEKFDEVMPGVFYNEETGTMNITVPDFLDDGSYNPSLYDTINGLTIPQAQAAKKEKDRRKAFISEVNKM